MSFRVLIGAVVIFNACVACAVNALYIYSTQQDFSSSVHFCFQLSMSVFRLLYSAIAFPILSRSFRSAVVNIRFRFMLLILNNLLIPCVVTALTSDACFQVMHCSQTPPCFVLLSEATHLFRGPTMFAYVFLIFENMFHL